MGFFGWTMMILFWGAVVVLLIWAIRSAGATRSKPKTDAIALLERRFVAGEIDRDEFEDRKRLLE
ncbi:MAG: SHOCT domain-containing protein [Acidimicrobiia bacterium]